VATPGRVNYLNNRDILKEIHLSKKTYCSFTKPEYHQFDIIVPKLEKINRLTIAEARRNRVDRVKRETAGETILDPKKIPATELIFRVMTYEHIPMAAKKLPKSVRVKKQNLEDLFGFEEDTSTEDELDIPLPVEEDLDHIKLNFPPFQHFMLDADGKPYLVGKSHWRGDLDTGEFSKDHGQMTRKLAHMFIKLCERYATRSNWRGYCVDESTQALTKRGWLGINEITTNDQILSYNNKELTWSNVKSIFRDNFNGLMHKLTLRGFDTLVTPHHKLVTERGLVPVELLKETDKLILMGAGVNDNTHSEYSNAFVELVGWIMTEGCYEIDNLGRIKRITVYQNPGAKADRIRNCLTTLGYAFSESLRDGKNICFGIARADSRKIFELFKEKNLTMEFITALTRQQRELLLETMIDGDGWRRANGLRSYVQKDTKHKDLFQALCAMLGLRTSARQSTYNAFGKPSTVWTLHIFSEKKNTTSVHCVNFHGGKRNGRQHPGQGKITHPNQPTTHYQGQVWCPETDYGCFVAKRNNTIYLTGNTYNEEMRGTALLQLSQIGLKFDESKSQNPFAYYTAAITNSFTRVLNEEKKNQNVRDDILEINGLNPSWSRQFSKVEKPSDER